jgi:hypothetical protein
MLTRYTPNADFTILQTAPDPAELPTPDAFAEPQTPIGWYLPAARRDLWRTQLLLETLRRERTLEPLTTLIAGVGRRRRRTRVDVSDLRAGDGHRARLLARATARRRLAHADADRRRARRADPAAIPRDAVGADRNPTLSQRLVGSQRTA